ncbi:hypothetical protein L3X38_032975 [Prunus dulcis]|uniref:Uncharacterized protein n=1 Tax=Prunus dulcis TaxID=3755 RepID=A0AAD4YVG6_PRUDU|nr:hypothetical protein L3X38_032975 [Prunus dulcis]
MYEAGIHDAHDIVLTSQDENALPITSLCREDAEPEAVVDDINLEPIAHDDDEKKDFIDDDPLEEEYFSRYEEESVHSDDYDVPELGSQLQLGL